MALSTRFAGVNEDENQQRCQWLLKLAAPFFCAFANGGGDREKGQSAGKEYEITTRPHVP
jgi:hypothetical protein